MPVSPVSSIIFSETQGGKRVRIQAVVVTVGQEISPLEFVEDVQPGGLP